MPLIGLGAPLYYGAPPLILLSAAPIFNTGLVLNADTDKGALCFQPVETVTIAKVSVGLGTITVGSTGLRVTVETLTVAGLPSGTLYHANATVDIAVADSDDDVWKGDNAFPGTFVLTGGDKVAFVVKRIPANTFNGIVGRMNSGSVGQLPYSMNNLTGADVKIANSLRAGLELSGGNKYYLPGLYPFTATAITNFASGSTPDEKGMQFRLPFGARVVGMWWHGLAVADAAAAVAYTASMYLGTSSLASTTVDNDVNADNSEGRHTVFFPAPIFPVANTDYIVALAPGTVNIAIREYTLPAAAWMEATSFGNANVAASPVGVTRTDGGANAWTPSATTLYLCGPIIDQIDTGAVSGVTLAEIGRRGVLVG